MKFYLDEHIPKGVVEGLRRRGVDLLTVQEAGRSGDSDEKQLAFAAREGRVLVTFDDDFLRLDAAGIPHTGVGRSSYCSSLAFQQAFQVKHHIGCVFG